MSEYVGIPDIQVILRKKSFQFIVPADFDLSVSQFYTPNADPNLISDNTYFMQEMGVAMVRPLFTNRANYVDSAVFPRYSFNEPVDPSADPPLPASPIEYGDAWKYFVEVPEGADPETEDETRRRIFNPIPTLPQFYGIKTSKHPKYWDDAHYKPINHTWKEGATYWYNPDSDGKYNGPEWETWDQDPPSGANYPVPWIHQISSADNVEWMLLQSGFNFINQPFWIDFCKSSIVKMNAKDRKGLSRYNRYGREVKGFFAIRVGWNNPQWGKFQDRKVARNYDGHGPYDIVFPIGGFPFIWDHGGKDEEIPVPEEGEDVTPPVGDKVKFTGFLADERTDESWVLPEGEGSGSIYVFSIRGKMVIKTSWAQDVWVFPQNYDKLSEDDQQKYENFYIPPGKIALMGRGFSFRMSFNPMEFDIYKDGEKRNPSAKIISQPVQERTDFQGKVGGLLDCFNYDRGEKSPGEIESRITERLNGGNSFFQNFLTIPNATEDNDPNGDRVSVSYGCDIVSTPYEGSNVGALSKSSHTSMMIPVDGTHPYSSSFDPNSESSVVYTKIRSPEGGDRAATNTRIQTHCGFREKTVLDFSNKIIEIGMNCRSPMQGRFTGNTSDRFASPIVWRVKGKHYSPTPDEGVDIDVSRLVENISYDCNSPDFFTVRQNYKIRFIIPKQGVLEADYDGLIPDQYLDRKELIKLLTGGLREVQVRVGWLGTEIEDPAGSTKRVVFTGISNGMPIKNEYAIDKITLNCNDRIQLLEDYPILNSPWYDGMNLSDAYMHLSTLSGLPKGMFKVNSERSYTEVLDMGYNLTEPTLKFDNGTPLFDALKVLAKRFWHVIRTNRFGIVELTDLNKTGDAQQTLQAQNAVIDDLGLTDDSYVFYMDGAHPDCTNPFQRIYDSVTINKTMNERLTSVEIFSTDRRTNKLVFDARGMDVDGIENPESPDFLGYRRPFRQQNPAFGTTENVRYYKELLEKHMFQTPLKVSFTTYGRPTLRPFDIIALQLPEVGHDSYFGVYNPAGGASEDLTEYVKLRVMAISGEIDFKSDMKYSMTITAEHK